MHLAAVRIVPGDIVTVATDTATRCASTRFGAFFRSSPSLISLVFEFLLALGGELFALVLDIFPYATTSPVYVDLPGGLPADPMDAAYFAAWLDRAIADAQRRSDFKDERERKATLDYLRSARARFERPGL